MSHRFQQISLQIFTLAYSVYSIMSCSPDVEIIEGNWLKGTHQEQINSIEIQFRGMDKTMLEIGYRYQELYWSGQDENWPYAEYQLNKIEKSLRLGLQRRPKRKESAKYFLNTAIPELKKTINSKQKNDFNTAFNTFRLNCTSCHNLEGFSTFKIEIPKEKQSPIRKIVF